MAAIIDGIPLVDELHQSLVDPEIPHVDELTGFFVRTVQSPLFWTTIATVAVLTFSAIILTGVLGAATIICAPIAIVALAALGIVIYQLQDILWYELSLTCVVATYIFGHPWHNEIDDYLHLGAIPLRNLNHAEELTIGEKPIGAILAVLNQFETESDSIGSEPVRPDFWANKKVKYLRIDVSDLNPLSPEQLDEGADYICANVAAKVHTYVHCKAGRGRSASEVVAYLLKYREELFKLSSEGSEVMSQKEQNREIVNRAIEYVRNKRPVLTLSYSQREALLNYYETRVLAAAS